MSARALKASATQEEGRKGSIIAGQYARGERVVKQEVGSVDVYPANEEIAKAVQQKVAVGGATFTKFYVLVLI